MDYCRRLVTDYLRADRSLFLNEECTIQLMDCRNPDDTKSWRCDVVVADFRDKQVWLVEVTYDRTLYDLRKRLNDWKAHWDGLCYALRNHCCHLPEDWPVRIWVFIPADLIPKLEKKLNGMTVRITPLEDCSPWKYRDWDRDRKEDSE